VAQDEQRRMDAFCHQTDEPELEVVCRVLNVNPNHQEELKKKSKTLHGYTVFVEKVRENHAGGEDMDTAVKHAMQSCISEHILEDFFKARGDEVRKVMQFDMRWERREQLIREEERAEGRAEGREEGAYIKLITLLQRKAKRGKTLAEMADELEESEDTLRPICEAIREKGADCPAEEVYTYLFGKA